MGDKRPEQCEPHQKGAYHRWLKRHAKRLMRRLWRRKGEDAPTKVPFRGYET